MDWWFINVPEPNYYYEPYTEDGFYEQAVGYLGGQAGQELGTVATPGNLLGPTLGGLAGQTLGGQIGWTMDNWRTIEQNFNTLVAQLNDWRYYVSPFEAMR